MELNIDYKALTLREQKALCEASDSKNLNEFIGKLREGDPTALAAACWALARQSNPSFTMEDAYDLSMTDLEAMFAKNAPSGAEAASSTTSSDPSAGSTVTRPPSSGTSRGRTRAS